MRGLGALVFCDLIYLKSSDAVCFPPVCFTHLLTECFLRFEGGGDSLGGCKGRMADTINPFDGACKGPIVAKAISGAENIERVFLCVFHR